MNYENLKDYLAIILDMEKNAYIQDKTLKIMRSRLKTLGTRKSLEYPTHYTATPDYGFYILKIGAICAVIMFIIDIFINWGEFWDRDGIFAIILAPLHGILPGLGVGLAGGLIIGSIVAAVKAKKEQKELDESYRYEVEHFNKIEAADNERVSDENAKKAEIQRNINSLEKKYYESKTRLEEFYNYNIVSRQYWHDIVAISSFYQYLIERRTYCLEYDRKTGDRGAYNIYNEELQRGIIISQLNVVIDKLDQVIDNQRTLQITMREANNKIATLSNSVNNQTRQIKSSIQEQTAIETYNAERIEAELRFMNTMNILDHINRK